MSPSKYLTHEPPASSAEADARFAKLPPPSDASLVMLRDLQRQITDNSRSARASTGSVAAGAVADVTVTWPTAFADAAYTVVASVEQPDADPSMRVLKVVSRTAADVTVRVVNDAAAAQTGTVHAIAVHDA